MGRRKNTGVESFRNQARSWAAVCVVGAHLSYHSGDPIPFSIPGDCGVLLAQAWARHLEGAQQVRPHGPRETRAAFKREPRKRSRSLLHPFAAMQYLSLFSTRAEYRAWLGAGEGAGMCCVRRGRAGRGEEGRGLFSERKRETPGLSARDNYSSHNAPRSRAPPLSSREGVARGVCADKRKCR